MSIDENNSTCGRVEEIDYDELVPSECDLTKIRFSNPYEEALITRIYSKVSNLCSFLSDFTPVNLRFYLNQPDQHQFMPLFYAIKSNNLETVKYLLSIGSNPEKTSAKGDPASHIACLLGASIEIVDYLLSFNKDLYKVDENGWNVFHCACNQGHLHLVEYLVEKKFMNLNIKDKKTKLTGLQLAAVNDRFDIIEYLLNFNSSSVVKPNQATENIFTSNRPKSVKITSKLCAKNLDAFNKEFEMKLKATAALSTTSGSVGGNKHLISSIYESTYNKPSTTINNMTKINKQNNNKNNISVLSVAKTSNTSFQKLSRPKTVLEPVSVYMQMNRYLVEPLAIYNNQLINLKSCNDDGHNVFHLACMYGKHESVAMILKKFGSNQLDINKTDFKGRTCMDLAWNWVLSTYIEDNQNSWDEYNNNENSMSDMSIEPFYGQKNLDKLDKRISEEIKLIYLLNQYGAKFSSARILFYNFVPIKKSPSRLRIEYLNFREHETKIPFHPNENNVLIYQLRMQESTNALVSILVYLKAILFIFKLNLPTMFLKEKYFSGLDELKNMVPKKFSSTSTDSCSTSSSTDEMHMIEPDNTTQLKKDLGHNLHDLIEFIRCEIDDISEKQTYFELIQVAFECLSNINEKC